jgi:hypothetical protein
MTSEPPSEPSYEHDERVVGESEDPSGTQSRGRQRTVAAIVAALVVAVGVSAFLFVSDPETPAQQQPTKPAKGLACPDLLRALEAFEQGDQAEYEREIDRAAKAAENTLQNSGQVFGKPEEIALELDLGREKDVDRLLESAQEICLESERPSSG